MPEVVQSLWIGPKLSSMEKLCIQSFLKHGHPFHLYVYDHVEGVPEQAKLCDANEIVPSSRIFFYSKHNSCAGFANSRQIAAAAQKLSEHVCQEAAQIGPLLMGQQSVPPEW